MRTVRLLAATAIVAAGLVASGATATAAPSSGDPVIGRFGGCASATGHADVLLVMDTSGSLQDTDPKDARIAAARYLVDHLADFARESGVKLDVAVAGFANDFEVAKKWTPATSTAALDGVVDGFADRDHGFETDYWAAVNGAREYLSKKAAGVAHPCQAWLWFSDGMYDIDKRDSAAEQSSYGLTKPYGPRLDITTDAAASKVEAAGREALCRAGGLADQLRSQSVTTLAVGLTSTEKPDFGFFKGVATGSGSCGDVAGASLGEFRLATDLSDLFFAIDALADPGTTPISHQSPMCQGTVCPAGTHQFVLDASISRVHVLGGSDVKNYQVAVSGPGAGTLAIDPGSDIKGAKVAGASVSAKWLAEGTLEIDLSRESDKGWAGVWRIAFVDPAKSGSGVARSNIRLYGDLRPVWAGAKSAVLHAGDKVPLDLQVVRGQAGDRVSVGDLKGKVTVDADLLLAGGSPISVVRARDVRELSKPSQLDLTGVEPARGSLRVTLHVTTAAAGGQPGTTLEPQTVEYPVVVNPPSTYPQIPPTIDFKRGEEPKVTAILPVKGDGCVWLAAAKTITLPEGVSSADVRADATSADNCVSGDLPLTLTADAVGNGLVSGELTVMTAPKAKDADPIPVTVAFTYELEHKRDTETFLLALVLTMAAGILIPVALLYLVKWLTAKIPGATVSVGSLSGSVTRDSSFLDNASLTEQELRVVPLSDPRRLSLGGAELRTRMGLGLTEPGFVAVSGRLAVTSKAQGSTARSLGRLPLAVQDTWVALLDASDPQNGPVEVWFLLAPTSTKLADLLRDARDRVPGLVDKLRDAAPSSGTADGSGGASVNSADECGAGTGGSRSHTADEWGTPTGGNGGAAPNSGIDQW